MGFALLALIGAAAFGVLALLGVPRALWTLVGAALMLGAAGYAWQGRYDLAGSPARPNEMSAKDDPAMIDLRERLLGRFTADASFFTAADALNQAGDRDAAARVMLGGVRSLPKGFVLWTGLGSALARRDNDQVSPASLLAFQQAARLAPQHPAPPFYLGLAYVRAGDFERGRILWRRAIALSPENASYRRDIAILLAILERATVPPPQRR